MKKELKLHKLTEDLTDRVFGKLTVLSFAGYRLRSNEKRGAQWLCSCDCGNTKVVFANSLKTRYTLSCGDCNPISVGDKFGKLTVLSFGGYRLLKSGAKAAQWLCLCCCGNERVILSSSLKSGGTKSCGDCNPICVGNRFGKLTVLDFDGYKFYLDEPKRRAYWLCKCKCGKKISVKARDLKQNKVTSCGNCNPIKIGDTFGKLTVLVLAEPKIDKNGWKLPRWLCLCECGNKKTVNEAELKGGDTKSCGCLRGSFYDKIYKCWFDSTWELNFVKILEYLEIKWEREPKTFKLSNGKKYIPDFYLPEFNMFIEIKGWWREDKNGFSMAKEKTELFKKEYTEYSYYIIDTSKYKEIEKHFKNILV